MSEREDRPTTVELPGVPAQIGPERPHSRSWERRYELAVIGGDVLALTTAGIASVLVRVEHLADLAGALPPLIVATSVVVLLLASMAVFRCWDKRVLGQGSEEFNRVIKAFVTAAILLCVVGLALKDTSVRPWAFGVIPATALLALGARYGLRRLLHRRRRAHRCMRSVLAVGTAESVENLVERTERARYHGWKVTAACTPAGLGPTGERAVGGVPVVGDLSDAAEHARRHAIRIVAVAPAPGWTSERLHRLSWDLEGSGAELVVDPGLMEVGGPRLHIAPVDGLPMLRLTEPRFSGTARVIKNLGDRLFAAVLLGILAPAFVVLGLLVRGDGGPALYRQTRIGLGGRPFTMIKFRSMSVDADRLQSDLADANDVDGPLFKMRSDPRLTPIGRFLRRYSLDELPQLINVVTGSMSLVGPRPPLPDEVATFSDKASRKLLVRPGMTGMWQVNGRSDLPWEESIRLDLRYVENWSPALDLEILWKTVWAVISGRGAY